MKNIFELKMAIVTLSTALMMAACDSAPKGDNATVTDKQEEATQATGRTFVLDTAASYIRFTGHGVGKNHPGRFHLSSGKLAVADDKISGGEFVINIKSLEVEEKGEMFQNKLKPHLLSGDFFDADKFATARFEITKIEPYTPNSADSSVVEGANFNISGNLTLKNETKNVTFPAHIDLDNNTLKAKANFDVDRRQWQMNYGNDKSLGDKFISETVNIQLDLQAKGQDLQAGN